jgi:two-component system chemotaxis response regulator CheY
MESHGYRERGFVVARTLIIDDSPFARRVIRHQLTKAGCCVVGEAENAAQALRMFYELKPDLITLDVMMPEVEGVDSMRALREMRAAQPELTMIMVSAVPFDKIRDSYLKEGAIAYIVKPFTQFSFEPVRQKLLRVFRQNAA